VATVEFAVIDVVAGPLQDRHHPPASAVDREDVVVEAVRHEQLRPAVVLAGGGEAGREGDDAAQHVAVGEPERQGVGGTVGEAGDGEPAGS